MKDTSTDLGKVWTLIVVFCYCHLGSPFQKNVLPTKPLIPMATQFAPQAVTPLNVTAAKECPENNLSSVPLDLECMRIQMQTRNPQRESLLETLVSTDLRNCPEYGKDVRTLARAATIITLFCCCSVELRKLKSITIWAKPTNGEL